MLAESIQDWRRYACRPAKASTEVEALLTNEVAGGHDGFKDFWIFNQVVRLAGLSLAAEIHEEKRYPILKPAFENFSESNNELVGRETSIKAVDAGWAATSAMAFPAPALTPCPWHAPVPRGKLLRSVWAV
ncbi:hypothetical protein FI667_g7172, partial [Globisporangium splendens]